MPGTELTLDFRARVILAEALSKEPLENLSKMNALKFLFKKIGVSQEEKAAVGYQLQPNGFVSWNPEKESNAQTTISIEVDRVHLEVLQQVVMKNMAGWTLGEQNLVEIVLESVAE